MAIRTIAVTVEDVGAALESRRQAGRRAVLRVTPPFAGRMRARLHVVGRGPDDDPRPIHIHPERLVTDVPAYPEPGEMGERPAGTGEREQAATVEAWRAAVRSGIVDRVTLPGTGVTVDVAALGEQ